MMTELAAGCIRKESRFKDIEKFDKRVPLVSPVMHGDEKDYVNWMFESGRMTTGGENIHELEKEAAEYIGVEYATALSSGTAAIHMAVKLAAEKIYGSSTGISQPDGLGKGGALYGHRVFCSDLAFALSVNPVVYEGGEPVFIDASPVDWCMDPEALEIAFEKYPDVKIVIMTHLYGFPGQIRWIKEICDDHGALLIEDASESLGAAVGGKKTGSFGDYGVLSFDSDKIITGFAGGILLTNDHYNAQKVRSWSSQSAAPWNQHDELGYDYRMSSVIAGIIRSQFRHLEEHIVKKKETYERYQKMFDDGIMLLNPVGEGAEPNYWLSCMTVESSIVFRETRSEREYTYESQHGTAAPMEILDAFEAFNVEGRPIWKPMHMQPVFRNHEQITLDSGRRTYEDFYIDTFFIRGNESAYIFKNGLCLPSDITMTKETQERVVDIIYASFDKRDFGGKVWT